MIIIIIIIRLAAEHNGFHCLRLSHGKIIPQTAKELKLTNNLFEKLHPIRDHKKIHRKEKTSKLKQNKFSRPEKCPNAEFFLVRIFPHLDQKKLRIWTLFTQCLLSELDSNDEIQVVNLQILQKHFFFKPTINVILNLGESIFRF